MGRTITFNSATLKNTQTEAKKLIIFFNNLTIYLESVDKIKIILEIKFYFLTTFRKITVGGVVNQLITKFWPNLGNLLKIIFVHNFFSYLNQMSKDSAVII